MTHSYTNPDERLDTAYKVEAQLKSFMQQHASLNTAIKEMPEIEHYVPTQYIEETTCTINATGQDCATTRKDYG